MHCAVAHHGCGDAVRSERADEGGGLPVAVRDDGLAAARSVALMRQRHSATGRFQHRARPDFYKLHMILAFRLKPRPTIAAPERVRVPHPSAAIVEANRSAR